MWPQVSLLKLQMGSYAWRKGQRFLIWDTDYDNNQDDSIELQHSSTLFDIRVHKVIVFGRTLDTLASLMTDNSVNHRAAILIGQVFLQPHG